MGDGGALYAVTNPKRRLEMARRMAETEYKTLENRRDITEQQVKAGLKPSHELYDIVGQLSIARYRLAAINEELRQAAFEEKLTRRVDVELKDATVRQAAKALAQASDINVQVSSDVPSEKRIRMTANAVPFVRAVEAVAQANDLRITRTPEGLVLRPWPVININGNRRQFRSGIAPWSEEWGQRPGGDTSLSNNLSWPTSSSQTSTQYGLSRKSDTTLPKTASDMPNITSTRAGEFLVTEPGKDARGRPGIWLTVYRQVGAQLKQVARGFHPLAGGR